MNKTLLPLIALMFLTVISSAQTLSKSFTHNGLQRDYVLHIPANYSSSTSVPLILNFHGFGGNGSNQLTTSGFNSIADTAGFIVVSPTGTPLPPVNLNHWNVGGWTTTSTVDDIAFASALIDTIAATYNVDLMRVYSTGFSNGGFFSHRLACELGHRIAAIASVSGTFTPQMQANCLPTHPTPILQIHGTTDAVVPYNGTTGNGGMLAVDTVLNYWINYNNCNTSPSVTALPDVNTTDGSTVEHIVYSGGNAGVHVEHFKITGGAHDWPGTSGNMDINASQEIWKFFSRYTNTALNINSKTMKRFALSPNPAQNNIHIELPNKGTFQFYLFSITGQQIKAGTLSEYSNSIDLSDINRGLYILKIANQSYKVFKD